MPYCPRSEARASARAFVWLLLAGRGCLVSTFFAYLDGFGRMGPYVSRTSVTRIVIPEMSIKASG